MYSERKTVGEIDLVLGGKGMKQEFGFRGVKFEMPIRLQEQTPSD